MEQNTLRVIIVDDEIHICQLLRKIICWDSLNMKCIGVFDNSVKVLNFIRNNQPEIVLTDIRMPQLSGLELIREVRNLKISTEFIVISGYKEFEYAHQALQYGVRSYILKPVNEDELNSELEAIGKRIRISSNEVRRTQELQQEVDKSKRIIRDDLLKQILDGQIDEKNIESEISIRGDCYQVYDIKLDYMDYKKFDTKQDKITTERVMEIVESRLKETVNEILMTVREDLHMYCLVNYNHGKAREIPHLLNALLVELDDYLIGFEQYVVTIGAGREVDSFSDIKYSVTGAYRAVCNRLRFGTERLISEAEIDVSDVKAVDRIMDRHRSTLIAFYNNYESGLLAADIEGMFQELLTEKKIDMTLCYKLTEQIVYLLLGPSEPNSEKYHYFINILHCAQHCHHIDDMVLLIKNALITYVDGLREAAEQRISKPVMEAQRYVDEHFREKIVLEKVADLVGLHPIYLSTVFKKEIGMNFSEYIVKTRINEAKKLLVNTNETILVIAEEVGYKDSKYFSQLFRKVVGIKPAIYRRLHS